jgi:hypothetical protein
MTATLGLSDATEGNLGSADREGRKREGRRTPLRERILLGRR